MADASTSTPITIKQTITGARIQPPNRPQPTPAHTPHTPWGKKRLPALKGQTYRTTHPDKKYRIYVTINNAPDETGQLRPFEIFLSSNNNQLHQWMTFAAMSITRNLRHKDNLTELIEDMKSISDTGNSGYMKEGIYYGSIIAEVGYILERHINALDHLSPEPLQTANGLPESLEHTTASPSPPQPTCPDCGSSKFLSLENCETCAVCGYNRCGE